VASRLSGLFVTKEVSVGNAVGAFLLSFSSDGLTEAKSAYCGPYNSSFRGATDLAEKVANRSSTTREPTE
jgi:hypothetical protein